LLGLAEDLEGHLLFRGLVATPAFGIALEWQMPDWEIELLRDSDGELPISTLLRRIVVSVPLSDLREQRYFLYQLGIIRLLPPRETR
jgi:hypothetical protein